MNVNIIYLQKTEFLNVLDKLRTMLLSDFFYILKYFFKLNMNAQPMAVLVSNKYTVYNL